MASDEPSLGSGVRAARRRRAKNVVHHSDHGTQYTSIAFGIALCETFFSTLERELLARRRFETKAQARMAIFEFIEGWYNPIRRHSRLGHISPIEFERRHSMHGEHAVTHRPARSVACEAPAREPVDNRL